MFRVLLIIVILATAIGVHGQDPCDGMAVAFSFEDHPDGIQFHDQSTLSGTLIFFQWNFGDGSTSFLMHPVHHFAINGTYEVCLTISTLVAPGDTCTLTSCQEVNYTSGSGFTCDQYQASFEWEVLQGNTVVFHSTTMPMGGTHMWQFGDGHQLSGQQVTHTYDGPGLYHPCLVSYIWNDFTQETCLHSVCQPVLVGALDCEELVATFTATQISGLLWLFEDTTDPPATNTYWEVSDLTVGTGPVLLNEFPGSGTYQVCMGATWWNDALQDSCWNYTCDTFTIPASSCDTAFQVQIGWSTAEDTTYFTATSADVAVGYIWDLGDGMPVAGQHIAHSFGDPGTYTVCVSGWYVPDGQQDSCWATSCTDVAISGNDTSCDELVVDFAWATVEGGIQFTGLSSIPGTVLSVEWDFGDGESSSAGSPFHAYLEPAEYEVCLTVQSMIGPPADPDTCEATTCHLVQWEGGFDPCGGLQTTFNGWATDLFTWQFTTAFMADGHVWELGDGTMDEGGTVTHTYGAFGEYEVCLTSWWLSTTLDTCWSTYCEVFQVGSVECWPEFMAGFSWEEQDGSFIFQADVNLPVAGIIWDFGDGTNGTGEMVQHVYQFPGAYEVCVDAWYYNTIADDSCWAGSCQTLEIVGEDCDPEYKVTIQSEHLGGVTHQFTASSNAPADGFHWDLGDGTQATGEQVIHIFEPPGPYVVCVEAWYWLPPEDTCWTTACTTIDPVGIPEWPQDHQLLIHPVPARDVVRISAPSGAPIPKSIALITIDGRPLRHQRITQWPCMLEVGDLAAGTFLLWVGYEHGSVVRRIMIE